jgi:hypothetical protein
LLTLCPGAHLWPIYPVVVDDHYERLRRRALQALTDNESGVTSDDDLSLCARTTCQLLERTPEATRREMWEASADFDTARYAIPSSE